MSFGGYPFGGGPFGGMAAVAEPIVGLDLQLTIAGIDYTDNLLLNTLQVTDDLNSRNTCSFSLQDITKTLHLRCGEVVRVTYRGGTIFAGTVDKTQESVPADVAEVMIHQVESVDFNQLLDRHVIANKWPSGELFYTVITQTLNTYSDIGGGNETLTSEGVTASSSTVEQEPRLQVIVSNYDTISDFFDDLSDLTGYFWFIDYDKIFHFVDRTKFRSPYPLDDNSWQLYRNVKVTRSRDQYRNVQYLRAGKEIAASRVKEFLGDGKETSFTLDLEVAEAPLVEVKIGAGAFSAANIGIRGKDEDKDWYYEIGEKEITQDTGGTKLTTADTLRVTYRGYFKILKQGRNEGEIIERKVIEGGTGVYVDVESEEKIDDSDLASEKVDGLLRRYGRIQDEIEFNTDVDGFRSGQLIDVNLPDYGLSGEFLINGVELSIVSHSFINYTVKCISGEHVGTWVDFFKRNASKGRPFVYKENEKLELLRQQREQFYLTDNLSTTSPLAAAFSDNSSHWVVGITPIGGRRNSSTTVDEFEGQGVYYGPLIGMPAIVP